jgi:hypothetical protein
VLSRTTTLDRIHAGEVVRHDQLDDTSHGLECLGRDFDDLADLRIVTAAVATQLD